MGIRRSKVPVLPILFAAVVVMAACAEDASGTGPGGGSGGTGGDAGSGPGGTGGTAGSGGIGGTWSCERGGSPACGEQVTLVALPAGRGLDNPATVDGIAQLDYAVRVVGHEPADVYGYRRLTLLPAGSETPISFEYRDLADELDAPVTVGDEVIVRFDIGYDGIAVRNQTGHALRIHDLQGRLLWVRHYTTNQPQLASTLHFAQLEMGGIHPVCFTEPRGRKDQAWRGLEFDIALLGGEAVRASPGTTVEVRAEDRHGRLFVGSAAARDTSCLSEGEHPENELTLALVLEDPGPDRPACADDGDCGPAAYCERGTGGCGDGGYCAPRPTSCRADPLQRTVCGCDGNLYEGPCSANASGVDSVLPDSTTRCDRLFACGALLCRENQEACVRETRSGPGGQPIPYCSRAYFTEPRPAGCDPAVPTCACVTMPECVCTELAEGQLQLDCNFE